ncbi:MAG: ethanolamine ammonia-lyase subunit EutC [Terriglobales bacterium]
MSDNDPLQRGPDGDLLQLIHQRTPARLLVGRAGSAYTTATQLQLRSDHARARDAVWRVLDPAADFGPEFIAAWDLLEVHTRARSKTEFLLNPALGRELDAASAKQVTEQCGAGADLQIVIGDGLSAEAVAVQVPALLPLLVREAQDRSWRLGRPFVVHQCRVGAMNHVGELLRPRIVVLLIGERPGMSAADSLSAYMAYQPRGGHSDADRNLISNIHSRGISAKHAARRIVNLAAECMRAARSGALVKEPSLPDSSHSLSDGV